MMQTVEEAITMEEINQYARNFLQENYGIKLGFAIKRNNRLTRTLGRFISCRRTGESKGIDLSGRLLDYGTDKIILDILRHELIHYALYQGNMPYRDGQPYFENELKKHESHSTNTLKVGMFYRINCTGCNADFFSRRKSLVSNPEKFVSGCCRKKIKVVGTVIFDGENKEYLDL